MPVACPHCQVDIDDVVTTKSMLERVATVTKAKKLAEDALGAAQVKVNGFDAMELENTTLKASAAATAEASSRTDAMNARQIDSAHTSTFVTMFNAAMAGENPPEDYAAFLDGAAKENPLLASAYGKPAAPPDPNAPKPPPVVTTPRTTPNLDAGTEGPPPPQGKFTPAQLGVFLNGLSNEEATAWIAEHRGEY